MAATAVAGSSDHFAMMSRPQIGIDRLPVRRPSNNEPKEAMNCKSCRKRKIKCNRVQPSCEACQVFNCACVYDAIPKKRGPKTDVLEALLKRVNGLERRLKDEKKSDSPEDDAEDLSSTHGIKEPEGEGAEDVATQAVQQDLAEDTPHVQEQQVQLLPVPPPVPQPAEALAFTDALLDMYFARLHGKPYYILDEAATRQRLRDGQLPRSLMNAVYAVSVRYASHMCGGLSAAVRYSQEYAMQSRAEIDVDEPSIEHLQALLLLAMAGFQSGKGKKSYMLLSHAISMAFALSLHRELPAQLRIAPSEREGRRKLFWTCYLMDRFTVSGSKRPSLISDEAVCLRLPAWLPAGSHLWVDGNYFPNGSSLPYAAGMSNAGQGSGAMLVEIVRVLGVTNRYLAAGGVKGDSHFPWHAQSTLSRIRSDLDYWAANTQDAFTTLEALFGQPDSPTLVLSKLIYHLVHCLIYRPFLPVDLAELSGSGQHQSWQIEATNLCFLHANAIAELVEIGKNSSIIDWPSFIGYCICTAGTIHVHGAHYMSLREGDVFNNSSEFLAREMAHLYELRFTWAGVQHQRETLQTVYASHSQLVKSLATSPMRFSPVFQMEDFFDRYPASFIDGAHVTFSDVDLDMMMHESLSAYDGFGNGSLDVWMNQPTPDLNAAYQPMVPSQYMTQNQMPPAVRRAKRRRTTNSSLPYPTPLSEPNATGALERQISHDSYIQAQPLPLPLQQQHQQQAHHPVNMDSSMHEAQRNHDHLQAQTFTQSALSPSFNFSPMQQTLGLQQAPESGSIGLQYQDTFWGAQGFDHQTPSGLSQSAESAHTDPIDKDPFLSLLEQLAQNDGGSGDGGPSDLDFFLR
ncbi:hypothetical protein LTR36_008136 [Oleoguttula mirabilis]|uniref:Zn(2)-C6 fungal-type domain-containing protein n=1 Tax=Oleoguttula mirabilis TaxID=1507867 RepID=A0AAV9J9Y2_9PEZI|nr:hypothetical protein LTR36_008136 [Oleoguttula mirabilis]